MDYDFSRLEVVADTENKVVRLRVYTKTDLPSYVDQGGEIPQVELTFESSESVVNLIRKLREKQKEVWGE